MKDAKTITEFVKNVCFHYSLCYSAYFFDYDENDQLVSTPIFEDDLVTPGKLNYLSKLLGMSLEDIANADNKASMRIFNKYPFFKLLLAYEERKNMAKFTLDSENIPITEQRLLYRIFGEENLVLRYSDEDVLQRLEQQLKEYDSIVPGTYHPNGEITRFMYEASSLINFPECEQLLSSFFEVYERMESLFFKALKSDLSEEEINEYNLFVTYFRANEWASSNVMLHYDVLCKYRQVYIEEGYTQLSSYMKINRITTDFEPWRCKQFANNKELAQKYQNIYPNTKDRIKDLCMHIKYISCAFKWSDAPFIEDEDDMWAPEEFRIGKYQEWTHVYIPKTETELGNDAQSAVLMSKLASPVSKGGLIKNIDEEVGRDVQTLINRMSRRQRVK